MERSAGMEVAASRVALRIDDDGTLHLRGLNINIPTYWKASGIHGIYECELPTCKY
jgi:hypothetical protein